MDSQEWFKANLVIAAEEARRIGFLQTHLALLGVLQAAQKTGGATADKQASRTPTQHENCCNKNTLH